MNEYHIVAVYPSLRDAERAKSQLVNAGVHDSSIHLSSTYDEQMSSTSRPKAVVDNEDKGFWHWLFGDDSPEHEREWYDKHLQNGRVAMSVMVHEDEEHIEIAEMMVRAGGLDLENESTSRGSARQSLQSTTSTSTTSASSTRGGRYDDEDQVIPVYKEELAVGKRATENRYRVRAHVVERPVEESVELRDERVVVERRPASRDYAVGRNGGTADFNDREYEVIERHEEPVVGKKMRAMEEVVVRKDSKVRTETVRDKVRETEIEMDGKKIGQGVTGRRV